ncbi:MAG TPA: SNF2 helicase associated domain-containing protein, partial [Sphingobacteriaceae bacterium]
MLFDQPINTPKEEVRPAFPKDFKLDFEIGFLFNFSSSKSTRFDLEPVLILTTEGKKEYKRISLSVEKGLAFLHRFDDEFYRQLLEFSDNKILEWMTRTGNRFIRSHSGSWAHVSARELQNLRKHYLDLLRPMWPKLQQWPELYSLKFGKFSNTQQTHIKLGSEIRFSFKAELQGTLIVLKLNLLLDGKEADINLKSGLLLENDGKLFLPPDHHALAIFDQFKNGPLSFPLTVKKEVVTKFILPWLERYGVTISPQLKIELASPELTTRIHLSELNESNLMIRPQFHYDQSAVEFSDTTFFVEESGDKFKIIKRDKEQEKKVFEYLRTLHALFNNQRNNPYFYLPFDDVMKKGWFITMLRKVQDQGHSIFGWEDLKKFRYTTHVPRLTIEARASNEYFELKVQIFWGDQIVSLKEVRQAILNRQDTIMLEDGTLGHIPEEW